MFDFLKQLKRNRPMRIVVNGHPALRKVSEPIAAIDDDVRALAENLVRSLVESEVPGVGLAAPQIGINRRMIVVKTTDDKGRVSSDALPGELILGPRMPVILINPEIVAHGEETVCEQEGCLSLPGVTGEVTRWAVVTLRAQLLDGQIFTAECGGLLSRCLQHEIDHLDGKLFYDRLAADEQKAAAPVMRKLARREAGLCAAKSS